MLGFVKIKFVDLGIRINMDIYKKRSLQGAAGTFFALGQLSNNSKIINDVKNALLEIIYSVESKSHHRYKGFAHEVVLEAVRHPKISEFTSEDDLEDELLREEYISLTSSTMRTSIKNLREYIKHTDMTFDKKDLSPLCDSEIRSLIGFARYHQDLCTQYSKEDKAKSSQEPNRDKVVDISKS